MAAMGPSASRAPVVSIVICVYNGGPHLRSSVQSALSQTHPAIEVLLIDDGSTDGAVDALADIDDPRLRIVRQANAGKPAALNRALDEIRGDYYAIQDADDLSHPDRIARLLERIEADPGMAAVFSGYELILDGRRVAPRFRDKSPEECRRDVQAYAMPAHDPTAMYRVSAVRDLRYATDLPMAEGYDYILRVGERHRMSVVGASLYGYRVHSSDTNTTRDPSGRIRQVHAVHARARARRGPGAPGPPAAGARPVRSRHAAADNNLAAHFMESVIDQRRAGMRVGALGTGLACSRLHPLDPHYQKPLLYALMPLALLRRVRRRGRAGPGTL
jgi:glycosyltransferase involved in cell wall biosynthesis